MRDLSHSNHNSLLPALGGWVGGTELSPVANSGPALKMKDRRKSIPRVKNGKYKCPVVERNQVSLRDQRSASVTGTKGTSGQKHS